MRTFPNIRFFLVLCLLSLSGWSASVQANPITAKEAQRKEVLRYMHSVGLLTYRTDVTHVLPRNPALMGRSGRRGRRPPCGRASGMTRL